MLECSVIVKTALDILITKLRNLAVHLGDETMPGVDMEED